MKHKTKRSNKTVIQQMVNSLERHPFLSEQQLIGLTFNSKVNYAHAAELRRAVTKGEISRVRAKSAKTKTKYFYFVPNLL